MLNIVLFGPPGAGKGTQSAKIIEKYKLAHISTGDMFRMHIKNETSLGKKVKQILADGLLVPDSITIEMLEEEVQNNPDVTGFIFDGFPRTQPQAEALDKLLDLKKTDISLVLALEVAEDEIVHRILERGKASANPRKDDLDENIIRNRFQVYLKETAQVADHYKKSNKFVALNGIGTIEEIFEGLKAEINKL